MESVSPTVPLMPPPSAPHLLLQERIPSSFAVRRSCCFVSLALPPNPNGDRLIRKSGLTYDAARSVQWLYGPKGERETEADWSEHSLCPPDRLRLLD